MTQTMDGVALVLTEEPAHRDTATCRHTGTHGRSRRGQGAGRRDSPSPCTQSMPGPQSLLSFRQGLLLGKRGWDAVHHRQGGETPHATPGASEGTSGRDPSAGAQQCPLLGMVGWCSYEREASGQAGGHRGVCVGRGNGGGENGGRGSWGGHLPQMVRRVEKGRPHCLYMFLGVTGVPETSIWNACLPNLTPRFRQAHQAPGEVDCRKDLWLP